jgi:hypothetical protein
MAEHAKLSASGSSRWLSCPGSMIPDKGTKIDESSNRAAMDGTLCHEVAELCLTFGLDTEYFVGKIFSIENTPLKFTNEFATYVDAYIDYVMSYYKQGFVIGIESRISYENYVNEGFGTCDTFIIDHINKICHVIDLKCGRIQVEAKDNSQLMIYALGIRDKYNLTDDYIYIVHIVQPKIHNFDSFEFDNNYLSKFGAYVSKQANKIEHKSTERNASDKACKYCPNNPTCNTLKNYVDDTIKMDFDDLNNPVIESDKTIIDVYNSIPLITGYLANITKLVHSNMMSGIKYPNLKLVESKTHRQYTEDAEAKLVEKLGNNAYNQKLITITEATKIISNKKFIDTITYKPKGNIVIASIDDKRPEVELDNPSDDFDKL